MFSISAKGNLRGFWGEIWSVFRTITCMIWLNTLCTYSGSFMSSRHCMSPSLCVLFCMCTIACVLLACMSFACVLIACVLICIRVICMCFNLHITCIRVICTPSHHPTTPEHLAVGRRSLFSPGRAVAICNKKHTAKHSHNKY